MLSDLIKLSDWLCSSNETPLPQIDHIQYDRSRVLEEEKVFQNDNQISLRKTDPEESKFTSTITLREDFQNIQNIQNFLNHCKSFLFSPTEVSLSLYLAALTYLIETELELSEISRKKVAILLAQHRQLDCKAISIALMKAVHSGKSEIVQMLCALDTPNRPGRESVYAALREAVWLNKSDIVQILCNVPPNIQLNSQEVSAALRFAAWNRHWKIVPILCTLPTNKPNREALSEVLQGAVFWNQLDNCVSCP
jgi:hypothetical protein